MNYPLISAIILIVGLIGGKVASRFNLPSVTGYIIFGLLLGPSFTNIITKEMIYSLQFINHLALGMLALSIGAELHQYVFKKFGKTLFLVSLGDGLITLLLVTVSTYLLGTPLEIAVVLGVLAMTVSPSGVLTIIKEYKAKGRFAKNVMALVAIENLNCIIIFGITTAVIQVLLDADITGGALVLILAREMGMALLLGVISGIFLSFLVKRRASEKKFLVMLIGVILLNTGVALQYGLSAILINMTTGATITNLINRKFVLSSTLEKIELPIFVFFLTLAGAKLDLTIMSSIGLVGAGYIFGRLGGKVLGSYFASGLTDLNHNMRKNIGMALTPQAGVAIGLSIIAEQKLPHSNGMITGIVLSGVIFFEVVGPLLLKQALKNTGEID